MYIHSFASKYTYRTLDPVQIFILLGFSTLFFFLVTSATATFSSNGASSSGAGATKPRKPKFWRKALKAFIALGLILGVAFLGYYSLSSNNSTTLSPRSPSQDISEVVDVEPTKPKPTPTTSQPFSKPVDQQVSNALISETAQVAAIAHIAQKTLTSTSKSVFLESVLRQPYSATINYTSLCPQISEILHEHPENGLSYLQESLNFLLENKSPFLSEYLRRWWEVLHNYHENPMFHQVLEEITRTSKLLDVPVEIPRQSNTQILEHMLENLNNLDRTQWAKAYSSTLKKEFETTKTMDFVGFYNQKIDWLVQKPAIVKVFSNDPDLWFPYFVFVENHKTVFDQILEAQQKLYAIMGHQLTNVDDPLKACFALRNSKRTI